MASTDMFLSNTPSSLNREYPEDDYDYDDYDEGYEGIGFETSTSELVTCSKNLFRLLEPKRHYSELEKFIEAISCETSVKFINKLFKVKNLYSLEPIYVTHLYSDINKFNVLWNNNCKINDINDFLKRTIYEGTSFSYIVNVIEKYDKKINSKKYQNNIDYTTFIIHCQIRRKEQLLEYIFDKKKIYVNNGFFYPDVLKTKLLKIIHESTPNNEISPDCINIISSFITNVI
jgi:hypothetical protein